MNLQLIIQLLKQSDWYGCSKAIDIAKGVNELTTSVSQIVKQEKRKYHVRKKGY